MKSVSFGNRIHYAKKHKERKLTWVFTSRFYAQLGIVIAGLEVVEGGFGVLGLSAVVYYIDF